VAGEENREEFRRRPPSDALAARLFHPPRRHRLVSLGAIISLFGFIVRRPEGIRNRPPLVDHSPRQELSLMAA
jgi:hypothetical protein